MNKTNSTTLNRLTGIFLCSTLLLGGAANLALDAPAVVSAAKTVPAQETTQATTQKTATTKDTKAATKKLHAADEATASVLKKDSLTRIAAQLKAKGANPKKLSLEATEKKTVRVIVELTGEGALAANDNERQSFKKADKAENRVLAKQDTVQTKVEKLTGHKVAQEFGYLLNGFSIDAKVQDIAKIQAIKGVKAVQVADVVAQQDATANDTVEASTAWANYGVDGTGMVVAVIDSGIDANHKDLRLSDESKAKISKADSVKYSKELGYGTYESAKVPFAHNYGNGNDTDLVADDGVDHGMHVAGIIGANGEDPDGVTSIQGVAPEAQLLNLKIFANDGQDGPTTDMTIQAIEDAVKLGADVINMSLGSSDDTATTANAEVDAVNRAAEAGVVPVIAAGNDGVADWLGQGASQNMSTDTSPDTGLMSSPASAANAITVASSENSTHNGATADMLVDGKTVEAGLSIQGSDSVTKALQGVFPAGQLVLLPDKTTKDAEGTAIDPVADGMPGRGFASDFEGVDVTGKIAVVSRGINNFTEKMQNAEDAGAVGIIILNNADDDIRATITDGSAIPTLFFNQPAAAKVLAAAKANPTGTFSFSAIKGANVASASANTMSTFSTWGYNTDLSAKPDVTAPGGRIWSLMNDNQYQEMSGTSMATPMVAGSAALVLQAMKGNTDLTKLDLVNAVKLSLQNTAIPMTDAKHDNAPYSPRLQGAGEVRIASAIQNTVTLDYNGQGAASLKSIDSRKQSFDVTLTNHGTSAATYQFNDYNGVYTKALDDQSINYDTKIDGASITADQNAITVAPGTETTVTLTLSLPDDFATSQFAEGFVGFTSQSEDAPSLVMPYLAFYGDWGHIDGHSVFDGLGGDADSKFGYNFLQDTNNNVLGLDLSSDDYSSLANATEDESSLPRYVDFIDRNKSAISPNGDDFKDNAEAIVMTNRNVKTLVASIEDADGKQIRKLNTEYAGIRHFVADDGSEWWYQVTKDPALAAFDGTIYNGVTGQDELVPDGQYYYRLDATVDGQDSTSETIKLPVKVDSVAPKFQDLKVEKKSDGYHLTGRLTDATSGLSNFTALQVDLNGGQRVASTYHLDSTVSLQDYVDGNSKATALLKDKSFDITLSSEFAQHFQTGKNELTLYIDDNAGNEGTAKVSYAKAASASELGATPVMYNAYADEIETSTSTPYYDEKSGTYTFYGNFDRDFYLNGQPVKVDEDGNFVAHIKLLSGTTQLVFALDADNQRIIKKMNFGFTVLPLATFDKSGGSWTTYSGMPVYMIENAEQFIHLSGHLDGDGDTTGVAGAFFPAILASQGGSATIEWKYDNTKRTFSGTFSMLPDFDEMAKMDYGDLSDEERFAKLTGVAMGYPGDDLFTAAAYEKNADGEKISGSTDAILVHQLGGATITFDNVTTDGVVLLTASRAAQKGYDADTGIYKVTGSIATNYIEDLRIFGNSTDPDDPANQPTITDDGNGNGRFSYDLHVNPSDSRVVGYSYFNKSTGETVTGSFGFEMDTVFPKITMADEDTWQVSQKDDVDLEVWTNKDTWTLAGTAGDDLTGYQLYIDSDEAYRSDYDGTVLAQFSDNKDYKFSQDIDLSGLAERTVRLTLYDNMGNATRKTILIHHATEAPAAPVAKASSTELGNKPVLVTATQAKGEKIRFSLDDGKTWTDYSNGVVKGVNGDVQFKAVDKYGNESAVTTYSVTNVVRMIAATPTATLSDYADGAITLTLGYDRKLTDDLAAITHLQYSTDGGKTWQQYDKPLNVSEDTTFEVRVADDAGNISAAKTVTVTLPTDTDDNATTEPDDDTTTPKTGDSDTTEPDDDTTTPKTGDNATTEPDDDATTPKTGDSDTTEPDDDATTPVTGDSDTTKPSDATTPATGDSDTTEPSDSDATKPHKGTSKTAANWGKAEPMTGSKIKQANGWNMQAGNQAGKQAASWSRNSATGKTASTATTGKTGLRGLLPQTGEQLLLSMTIVGLTVALASAWAMLRKWGTKNEEK
ncbi:S8 family serine peptidase [Lacticaseibacillus kribbianus]|uniref:S8 family serine peptidase n=1 Tax=Lacticaseibacillus kribbianus TaxID=2926292 RepID=UPI001CD65FA8|nr:S8 family serine peptidase [Lacticaseibacillus kribbianus]